MKFSAAGVAMTAATGAQAETATARYDAGLALLESLGSNTSLTALAEISPDMAGLYVEHVFGDVLARDTLDNKVSPRTRTRSALFFVRPEACFPGVS